MENRKLERHHSDLAAKTRWCTLILIWVGKERYGDFTAEQKLIYTVALPEPPNCISGLVRLHGYGLSLKNWDMAYKDSQVKTLFRILAAPNVEGATSEYQENYI